MTFEFQWMEHSQHRGFSIEQGVMTVPSNLGKNGSTGINPKFMKIFCHTCSQTNNDNIKLCTIKKSSCAKNHDGSMEVAGTVKNLAALKTSMGCSIPNISETRDSKPNITVALSGIYSKPIKRFECCGHIQKHIGKAFMRLVDDDNPKVFVVNPVRSHIANETAPKKSKRKSLYRGISGQGRLIIKARKSTQGHYDAAIRNNTNVSFIKADIRSFLLHRKCLYKN